MTPSLFSTPFPVIFSLQLVPSSYYVWLGIAGRIKGELPASIEFVLVGIIPPPMPVPYLVVHYLALGPPSSSPMLGLGTIYSHQQFFSHWAIMLL